MADETDMVDRSGNAAGNRELGPDAALSAPELRQWIDLMGRALGAAWRLTGDEDDELVARMEEAGYVTLRDLGEATAEDLQTELQLLRPLARRMQGYFAKELARQEAAAGAKADANLTVGSASQEPLVPHQMHGTAAAGARVRVPGAPALEVNSIDRPVSYTHLTLPTKA